MTQLHKFEGKEVIGTKVKITGAGDGLSQALAIDPEELIHGQVVNVLVECRVDKIIHEGVKDTDSLIRVQSLKAGTATLVSKEFAAEKLEAQRVKIEEAKGVNRLDFPDGDPDAADGDLPGGFDGE